MQRREAREIAGNALPKRQAASIRQPDPAHRVPLRGSASLQRKGDRPAHRMAGEEGKDVPAIVTAAAVEWSQEEFIRQNNGDLPSLFPETPAGHGPLFPQRQQIAERRTLR